MAREVIAELSKPLLTRIHALPRLVVPLVTLLLVVVGALAPLSLAVPALVIIFAFVGWIVYLAWPIVPASGRALRVIMLALIAGIAVSRLVG